MLLAVHWLRKETERLVDLALFLRSHIVLLCKFGLSRLGSGGCAGRGSLALRRLRNSVRPCLY